MNISKFLGLTALALAASLTTACQDHFSTQEAYAICQDLTERNPATNPPEAFDDCVACYESCGGDCTQAGTSPESYVCPDELGEGGGTGEGGGGEE
jgi:hypothetical protein